MNREKSRQTLFSILFILQCISMSCFSLNAQRQESVRLTIKSEPTAGGSVVSDKKSYIKDETGTFVATANRGYQFTKWRLNDRDYSTLDTITIEKLPRDLRLTAYFQLITNTIKTNVNISGGGSVSTNSANNQFVPEDTAIIVATPNCGYLFSHWEGDTPDEMMGNTLKIFGVKKDLSFTAVFKEDPNYKPAISINEIMPCNLSTYMDSDYYNFSGFIEFANQGDCRENLKSYTITHYKLTSKGKLKLKWEWVIQQDYYVDGRALNLMWFDERYNEADAQKNSKKSDHSPYKLDADGGAIVLRKEGTIIDSIAYGATGAHLSYGRDGETEGFMDPTPYQKNNSAYPNRIEDRCEAVHFSKMGGLMESSFSLNLSCETEGASIYYTTDGKEPTTKTGKIYQAPIQIEANTCVRARAIHPQKLTGEITTHSYIFHDDKHKKCGGFTVPIVSLTVDNDYFYDNTIGIYITGTNGIQGDKSCSGVGNYNQDWQRPVNFEYIVDGEQQESREVESSIVGGCSITATIKSLALKTSKKTGGENYDYHFFQSKPEITHKTIHLRNGGNDNNGLKFRDGLMQTFAIGMNIDYQAYQPVAYYLNGKYMGLMNLNERTNADYVTSNYGVEEDEMDLVVISDQKGIYASKGDLEGYNELVDYLSNSDPNDVNYYKGACERMDMDEYIDYQILQQYMANIDWPGNNTKIWREKKEGSLFRWILYDMDYGLGMYGTYSYKINMFNWCQGKEVTNWGNKKSWMTTIFANLCKNKEFKIQLYKRYKEELETRFSHENIKMVFDSITALVDAEFCATKGQTATSAAKSIREYALNRQEVVSAQLEEFIGDLKHELTGESLTELNHILLYPNPTHDLFTIESDNPIESVSLYASDGILISKENGGGESYKKDIRTLSPGIYYVKIVSGENSITKKIIKQ